VRTLSPPDAPAAALLVTGRTDGHDSVRPRLILVNANLDDPVRVLVAPLPDDERPGVLFRVVLGAESVATTLDRKAIEAAMGESWLARFLKFGKSSRSFNCYARTAKAKRAA
jgi:hypothetical protein